MIRSPVVSGQFYPDEIRPLQQMIDYCLKADEWPITNSVDQSISLALIVPHAGYVFSGLVAGSAYRLLIGKNIETVVLVGLSHKYNLKGAVVYSRGSFLTPLGNIEIDEQMASEIMERADIGHMSKAHQVEHCLEVQLPILVNDDSIANISTLSNAISKSMIGRSTLLIGSTDLCHYPTYSSAIRADQVTISALSAYDTNYLRTEISAYMNQPRIPNLQCLMCSTAATYTTIETSKKLGGKRLQILAANNSGDVPQGDLTQVVGYVSAAIY